MSDWSTIKKGFIEWLKTQDSDFKETDKDFAPIKYSEKFKLYIEKHDDDETVNMDSFTKNSTDSKTLFDNMFDDYINELSTSDAVFVAIDGLADGKKDGKISTEEKNIFLTKVAAAGFDGDIKNLSFDDLYAAITKIKSGDLSFLQTNNNNNGGGGDDDDDKGKDDDKNGIGDITNEQISSVQTLSALVETWAKPVEAHKVSSILLKTGQVNSGGFKHNSDDTSSIMELGEIEHEISCAETDLTSFTKQYESGTIRLNQANSFNQMNETAFNEICNALMQSNEEFAIVNNQITSINETITNTETAISVQCSAKDTLSISLSTIDNSIWSINSQIANAQDDTDTSELQSQLAALKEKKKEVAKQLEQISEEILVNKTLLEKSYDDLDTAYRNLELIDISNSQLSDNQKSLYSTIIENKRIITQQEKMISTAQASMVACDSYIQALYTRKEELLIEQKEQEAQKEKGDNSELSAQEKAKIADKVINDEDGIKAQKNAKNEILKNVNNGTGLINPDVLQSEEIDNSQEENVPKTSIYTVNGIKVKVSYSKADDDKDYKCSVEVLDSNDNSLYNTNNHTFKITTNDLSFEYSLIGALSGEHSTDYGLEITNGFDKWNASALAIKDKDGNIISTRTISTTENNDAENAHNYTSIIETDKDGNKISNAVIETLFDEENNVITIIQEGKTDENGNYTPSSALKNTKNTDGYEIKKEIISYIQQENDGKIENVEQINYTKIYEYKDDKISSITTHKGTQEGIIDELTDYDYTDGLKVTSSKNDATGALSSQVTTVYNKDQNVSSITETITGTSVQNEVEYATISSYTTEYDENGKLKLQTGTISGKDKDGNTLERIQIQDADGNTISDRYTENKDGISTTTYITAEGNLTIKLGFDNENITQDNYKEILSNLKAAIDNSADDSTTVSITSPIALNFKLENEEWVIDK